MTYSKLSKLTALVGAVSILSHVTSGVILTPQNPTSSGASISLISDDGNTQSGNSYVCNVADDYSDFCVELLVDNTCSLGVQTINIEVDVLSDSGDTDILGLFSLETNTDTYSYFSYLNDFDGFVGNTIGDGAGVFAAPQCGSTSLLTFSGADIAENFLNNQGGSASSLRASIADGDGSNYELMSDQRVDGQPPLRYRIINNQIDNTLTTSFETDSVDRVTCEYPLSLDTSASPSDSFTFVFGADDGQIRFNSFDVTTTCSDSTCDCDSLQAKCRVSGDPHWTTFDGTRHHFQGGGTDGAYYDYVTECLDDNNNQQNNLPFNIAAQQKICNGPYTCVFGVKVELDDGTVVNYPSNGIPTDDDGNDARGTGSFSFNGGTATYTVSSFNFEITFPTVDGDEARLTLSYKGKALNIRTCNCLLNQLCGLCGTYNNDPFDDFTRCDNGTVLDSSGTARMRSMNAQQWENTLEFGDSCCREDLDENGVCPPTDPDDTPLPDNNCLDGATDICEELFDEVCGLCSINDSLNREEFLEDCEIDVCAAAGNDLQGCEGLDCAEDEWIETSVNKCDVDCDEDGNLGTLSPTEEPTAEPQPAP